MIKEKTMLKQCATKVCSMTEFPFARTDLMHLAFNIIEYSLFSEVVGDTKENITKSCPQPNNLSLDISTKTETEMGKGSYDCAKNHQDQQTYVLNLKTLETRF